MLAWNGRERFDNRRRAHMGGMAQFLGEPAPRPPDVVRSLGEHGFPSAMRCCWRDEYIHLERPRPAPRAIAGSHAWSRYIASGRTPIGFGSDGVACNDVEDSSFLKSKSVSELI